MTDTRMDGKYCDGSDHEACDDCLLCVTCQECKCKPEPEHWFSDEAIVEQSSALIKDTDGNITKGISIVVRGRDWIETEVLLEYDELKAALVELENDL